jgi:hypothetical protein
MYSLAWVFTIISCIRAVFCGHVTCDTLSVAAMTFQICRQQTGLMVHRHARPMLPTLKRVTTQRYVRCAVKHKMASASPTGLLALANHLHD